MGFKAHRRTEDPKEIKSRTDQPFLKGPEAPPIPAEARGGERAHSAPHRTGARRKTTASSHTRAGALDSQPGSLAGEHVSTRRPPSRTLARARMAPKAGGGTQSCVTCPGTQSLLQAGSPKAEDRAGAEPSFSEADGAFTECASAAHCRLEAGARAESSPGPVQNGRWAVKHTAPPGGQLAAGLDQRPVESRQGSDLRAAEGRRLEPVAT